MITPRLVREQRPARGDTARRSAYPSAHGPARDPDEARQHAGTSVAQGATALKIYFRLPLASAKAVIGVCNERKIPCTAHLEILDARELIAGVLEGAGARVLSASSASEAIARASAVRPDILVTDLGLPGEDGYAVLERVRGMFPDIPALALTAYARATDRERVLAAGFKHHVVKPVDPQQLLQLIAAAL